MARSSLTPSHSAWPLESHTFTCPPLSPPPSSHVPCQCIQIEHSLHTNRPTRKHAHAHAHAHAHTHTNTHTHKHNTHTRRNLSPSVRSCRINWATPSLAIFPRPPPLFIMLLWPNKPGTLLLPFLAKHPGLNRHSLLKVARRGWACWRKPGGLEPR